MDKKELRKEFLDRRKALSPAELNSLNEQIFSHFKALQRWREGSVVHLFLSSSKFSEVDTKPILSYLREQQVTIVIPRLRKGSMEMDPVIFRPDTSLSSNGFGISEPVDGEVYRGNYDMILVPLLAFDSKGNRVGYGKGYYDYFLSTNAEALKVGLSFFPPLERIDEIDVHDVPLDQCITPDGVYDFRK